MVRDVHESLWGPLGTARDAARFAGAARSLDAGLRGFLRRTELFARSRRGSVSTPSPASLRKTVPPKPRHQHFSWVFVVGRARRISEALFSRALSVRQSSGSHVVSGSPRSRVGFHRPGFLLLPISWARQPQQRPKPSTDRRSFHGVPLARPSAPDYSTMLPFRAHVDAVRRPHLRVPSRGAEMRRGRPKPRGEAGRRRGRRGG